MPNQNDNSDIFDTLYNDTQGSIDVMAKGPVDVSSQLEALERESETVSQITDAEEKEQREKILAAKFDTLRESVRSDEKDMAKAVYGMKVLIDGMDAEFQNLISFSDSEQAIIDNAEAELKRAQQAEVNAKQAITEEENDNGFLNLGWGKQSRVDTAKQAHQISVQRIKTQKTAIAQAIQKAEEMKRERLMDAEIEDTLNMVQVMGQKTVDIMRERTKSVAQSLESIKARKEKAFDIREEAVARAQDLLVEVNQLKDELRNEELAIDSFEVGTKERDAQDRKVSNMRSNLEELEGKLKVTQAVADEKTKSIQEHEAFQTGQQKLLSNHNMWIATLVSKLQEDLVKDAAYLEMLKAASDQEIAQNVDGMSDEKNARQMENVAKVIIASDKAYMEKMEATPKEMQRRANIEAAIAEHKANLSEDQAKLRQEMIDNYGIDPLASSQFTYENKNSDVSNDDDNNTPVSPEEPVNESEQLFG